MLKDFPVKKGDIEEFYFQGQRLKQTIEEISENEHGHVIMVGSIESVPTDYVFKKDETMQEVVTTKKTWISKIKGWFN